MAGDADFEASAQPTLQQLATFFVDELFDIERLKRFQTAAKNAHAEGATIAAAAQVAATTGIVEEIADTTSFIGSSWTALASFIMSLVVENAFEVDVSNADIAKLGFSGGRHAVAGVLAKKMVEGLTGGSTSVDASAQPAANYLSVVLNQAFESWAIGEVVEIATAFVPGIDKIEHLAELGDKVVAALGIGDSSSRVLRPYIDNLVVEPLRRHIAKTYRPNLLSEGDILRAFLRGDYSGAEVADELALLGWSDRRQDVLLKSAFKNLSLDDTLVLIRDGQVGRDYALANLRAQGYDAATAESALLAAETRRHLAIQDDSLAAVRSAYADRRISDSEFSSFLTAIIPNEDERAAHEITARTIRDVNTKALSVSQARECVKAGIVPMAAFREALTRDGYDPESALALELLLASEIDKESTVAELRLRREAELAAEKVKRDAERAARQLEIDAARALARRGPISELVRAAVTGLIPISRATEVLAAQYDGDTVAIYVADIEQQRVAYLAQQAKANEAKKAAELRRIDVGQLEQAVFADILTVEEFRRQLDLLKFAPADADVLTATLRARKADVDAAKAKRAAADVAAKKKSIDLGRLEALVRRGARSLADYDALLVSLDFDDAARAAMTQLLQLQIDDDRRAAALRATVKSLDPAKGLSLDQFRRAVLLNLRTVDEFQSWLIAERYTTDAQAVLVAELRDDVAQADAARRRRDVPAREVEPPALALTTVARAARLGIVPPSLYQQRLLDAGYSDDDVAIEMALLIQEIADIQTARARQAAADAAAEAARQARDAAAAADAARVSAPPPAPTLTLAQLAAAVRAGVQHLEDYRGRASALGLSKAEVDTLVRVLGDELASSTAARARRVELESTVKPGDVSIAVLADRVRAGALPLDGYVQALDAAGLDPVDVDLLTSLLEDELVAG